MTAQNYTGDRLGPYRLLERLGEGGMGVVYLAAAPAHRKVAVKALRPAVAPLQHSRQRRVREPYNRGDVEPYLVLGGAGRKVREPPRSSTRT